MKNVSRTIAFHGAIVLLGVVATVGCNSSQQETSQSVAMAPNSLKSEVALSGALPVGEARTNSKNGDQVTIVGLIGGSEKPFVSGLAAFSIVDPKVPYCAAAEGCPTPWDYCCEQGAVKDNIAFVKLVDDHGKVFAQDAKKLIAVKELTKVTVQGTASRDDAGNMTILANRVHIEK